LTATSRIQAILATDEHADAIATFYRETWGEPVTADSILAGRRRAAADNVAAPGEVPPVAIVLEGDRVIGHYASIPYRIWDGVTESPAHWVKGLMVVPEYRNGPVGFLVVKTLTAQLPLATALVVAPAARRLLSALGYSDLGAIPNYVRPLRPGRLARRLDVAELAPALPRWVSAGVGVAQRVGLAGLAGGAAGIALDLIATATRRPAARLDIGCASEPPSEEELDEVWARTRGGDAFAASPVRNGRHLRWRFSAAATGEPYLFVTARDGARLVGVAVLRRPRAISDRRLRGLRVATISDVVFPSRRAEVGLALLGGVERAARAAEADAILCTTSQRALARLLRRQAYLRLPGNVHFLLRDGRGEGSEGAVRWPQDLASWGLARGDGDADEVF